MARKWTKLKAWCTCKVVVLLIKPIAFSPSPDRHRCRCLSSLMFLVYNRTVSRTNTCSTLAQEREKKEKERQTSSLPNNFDDDHNCMCDWGLTAVAERRRSQDINKRKRFLHCFIAYRIWCSTPWLSPRHSKVAVYFHHSMTSCLSL